MANILSERINNILIEDKENQVCRSDLQRLRISASWMGKGHAVCLQFFANYYIIPLYLLFAGFKEKEEQRRERTFTEEGCFQQEKGVCCDLRDPSFNSRNEK